MITKTVRAESMLAALEEVKKELGPEALIVSVRKVPGGSSWQVWRKPLIEVVAVQADAQEVTGEKVAKAETPPKENKLGLAIKKPFNSTQKPQRSSPVSTENAQKTTPKKEIAVQKPESEEIVPPPAKEKSADDRKTDFNNLLELQTEMGIKQGHDLPIVISPVLNKTIIHLRQQRVDETILQKIMAVTMEVLNPQAIQDEIKVLESLHRQLEAFIRIQKESEEHTPRIICIIGMSGSGKTSLCGKLAALQMRTRGKSVSWISADTVRTGGIAETKTYAEAIGVPLKLVYTPEELVRAVASNDQSDIVLVDTPACNPRNESSIVELGAFLTAIPRRITWVIIPATVKEIDLQNALSAFSPFRPRALVITKLDETNSYGEVYNIAWKSQLPVVYFSKGSRVLNDLIPARSSDLVDALFQERFVT